MWQLSDSRTLVWTERFSSMFTSQHDSSLNFLNHTQWEHWTNQIRYKVAFNSSGYEQWASTFKQIVIVIIIFNVEWNLL